MLDLQSDEDMTHPLLNFGCGGHIFEARERFRTSLADTSLSQAQSRPHKQGV